MKVDVDRESPDGRVAADEFRRGVKGEMGFEEGGVACWGAGEGGRDGGRGCDA